MAKVLGAPEQETMGATGVETNFANKQAMLVKQTMRGCCQECMGCEAKSEYKISTLDWKQMDGYKVSEAAMNAPDEMYAIEQSSCLMRCCWRDGRPFKLTVSEGGDPGGTPIVQFDKPCGCPLNFSIPAGEGKSCDCPCCCLLPKVDTMLPGGAPLGSESVYIQDINLCVPKLKYKEGGKDVYVVKPETCCGGCCIACNCCSGKGLIYIPFYFHNPEDGSHIVGEYNDEAPQIRKVWAGMKKECCSTADTFAVKFPDGIDAKRKAGLLGMTFLIDFTVFERQQDNEVAG